MRTVLTQSMSPTLSQIHPPKPLKHFHELSSALILCCFLFPSSFYWGCLLCSCQCYVLIWNDRNGWLDYCWSFRQCSDFVKVSPGNPARTCSPPIWYRRSMNITPKYLQLIICCKTSGVCTLFHLTNLHYLVFPRKTLEADIPPLKKTNYLLAGKLSSELWTFDFHICTLLMQLCSCLILFLHPRASILMHKNRHTAV